VLAVAGEGRIAQRFAIDWVRLFADGRAFRGDPHNNASCRAFGARVFAVADGTVVETLDSLPENVPDPVARAVPITPRRSAATTSCWTWEMSGTRSTGISSRVASK
jgi:hypothetical protein